MGGLASQELLTRSCKQGGRWEGREQGSGEDLLWGARRLHKGTDGATLSNQGPPPDGVALDQSSPTEAFFYMEYYFPYLISLLSPSLSPRRSTNVARIYK